MKQFLWQDDLVSVAKFIHACLDKMFSCETGLSNDSQASDQPDVAGRRCNLILILTAQHSRHL